VSGGNNVGDKVCCDRHVISPVSCHASNHRRLEPKLKCPCTLVEQELDRSYSDATAFPNAMPLDLDFRLIYVAMFSLLVLSRVAFGKR
jgi:hypothetical protein